MTYSQQFEERPPPLTGCGRARACCWSAKRASSGISLTSRTSSTSTGAASIVRMIFFAKMEAHDLAERSIELKRNIGKFAYIKRPMNHVTPEMWCPNVQGLARRA